MGRFLWWTWGSEQGGKPETDPPPPLMDMDTPPTPTFTDEQLLLIKDITELLRARGTKVTSDQDRTRDFIGPVSYRRNDRYCFEDEKVRIDEYRRVTEHSRHTHVTVYVKCISAEVMQYHNDTTYGMGRGVSMRDELHAFRPGYWTVYIQKVAKRARQTQLRAQRKAERKRELAQVLAFSPVDDATCFK